MEYILKYTLFSSLENEAYTICYYTGELEPSALLDFWKTKFGTKCAWHWSPVLVQVSLPSNPEPGNHIQTFTF